MTPVPARTAEYGTIERVLEGALRAPSAHNAQPWRLSRIGPRRFSIWYAFADKLGADPGRAHPDRGPAPAGCRLGLAIRDHGGSLHPAPSVPVPARMVPSSLVELGDRRTHRRPGRPDDAPSCTR
jgi:hypothetical protein